VTGFDAATFRRRACTCGAPPVECVADETILVQYSHDRASFRNKPRLERESAISVLIAEGWTLEQVSTYVRQGLPPPPEVLKRAGLRQTIAGKLRKAGFAVVHTPGAIANGPHVSVVWPATTPFELQEPACPDAVSAEFDSCFNIEEET
jgi:hypothetical protein